MLEVVAAALLLLPLVRVVLAAGVLEALVLLVRLAQQIQAVGEVVVLGLGEVLLVVEVVAV